MACDDFETASGQKTLAELHKASSRLHKHWALRFQHTCASAMSCRPLPASCCLSPHHGLQPLQAGCCHTVSTAESILRTETRRSPCRMSNDRSTACTGRSARTRVAKLRKGSSRYGRTGAFDPSATYEALNLSPQSGRSHSRPLRASNRILGLALRFHCWVTVDRLRYIIHLQVEKNRS